VNALPTGFARAVNQPRRPRPSNVVRCPAGRRFAEGHPAAAHTEVRPPATRLLGPCRVCLSPHTQRRQVGKPVPRRCRGTSLKTCPGRDLGRQPRPNPPDSPIPVQLQKPRVSAFLGQVDKPVPRPDTQVREACCGRGLDGAARLGNVSIPENFPLPGRLC